MIGKQLGHYVVLHQVGSGGMGDVYVAHDTRLDRRVALKVPRLEAAATADRRALFHREAKAAAALNHPNIVHLYSVEDADGLIFITMELVQGRSLRELLIGRTPLPLARTFAFAVQIAEGLACAHAAGIVHRDLKPGNVMITQDDRVKILDFGVAKFLRPHPVWHHSEGLTTAGELSTSGTAVGTLGYMSPEQALGHALDARTDLFALGVILFEMATGRVPFEGNTPAAVFDQLLNHRCPSPLRLNPALPPALAAVIDKALEKDPERRYSSAKDLLEDLRGIDASASARISSSRAPATRHATASASAFDATTPSSIVVLPFVDLSPQRDQEYFCHGIAEEIINSLTRVPQLRVISRTSAFAFHGKGLDVTEIGRRLRVATALEGSVRKSGNRLRVTVQLVNAEDSSQLWSKRFDCELSDIFAIQDDIAATIVHELQVGIAADSPATRRPFDTRAHDAYLRGMYALNKWTAQSVDLAIAAFREAIGHDGGFAPAYVGLAEGQIWLYSGLGALSAHDTVPEARWAVAKAVEIDATSADAHRLRALVAMNHDWDRKGAEDGLLRAVHLAPGSAASHLWNAWRLAVLERQHEAALVALDKAEGLNPLDLQLKTQIGYVYYFQHDFDRALAQFEKVLMLEPSFAFAHYAVGDLCTQRGEYDRAFRAFERSIELGGRSVNHIGVLGYAYARSGNRDRAQEHLAELTRRRADGYVSPMWVALVYLGLRDLEGLFHWLDRAFEERDGSLILITAAVEFDPVREDPRFKALLERMGLAHLATPRV